MNETGIIKRSVMIAGHRTSVSLEELFWQELQKLAVQRDVSVAGLIGSVDASRKGGNLSSALRILVLQQALERRQANIEKRA